MFSASFPVKDLSAAIAVEAAELQELFLWTSAPSCARHLREDRRLRTRFAEELADVLIFSLSLADATGTDVSEVIRGKLKANESKYPVHAVRGRAGLDAPRK